MSVQTGLVIWRYRLLLLLNAPVLAFAVFMAVEAVIVFGLLDITGVLIRVGLLAWPVTQIAGYMAASRAKHDGNVDRAVNILLVQFLLAGGLTVAYLAWVFQA